MPPMSPTEALARIRGWLRHPVRTEDPECCLFVIDELLTAALGDIPGIAPEDEEDAAAP